MRLLPTEQATAVETAISEFEQSGELIIREPCDCGDWVKHNNGGNYHQIISLRRDGNKVYSKFDTTCELTPESEWQEEMDWQAVIRDNADWL